MANNTSFIKKYECSLKPFVKSMTWSGKTKSVGLHSCFKDPTDEKLKICFVFNLFELQCWLYMEQWFGEYEWSRPCPVKQHNKVLLFQKVSQCK